MTGTHTLAEETEGAAVCGPVARSRRRTGRVGRSDSSRPGGSTSPSGSAPGSSSDSGSSAGRASPVGAFSTVGLLSGKESEEQTAVVG